jgi:hypothetical protein
MHHVLDAWFEQAVKPRLKGHAFLVGCADDFAMGFACEGGARRLPEVVPKRFGKYGLQIHPDKTRSVPFVRPTDCSTRLGAPPAPPPGAFDFLGFTRGGGRSRQGRWVVKRRAAGRRFRRALKRVAEWCRRNRPLPIREQYEALALKRRGHFSYYGVIGNRDCLSRFRYEVMRPWRKWRSRRRRRGQWSWARLNGLLRRLILPWPPARGQPCVANP